ncbi:DUF3102 domain-containing protein [Azospirillum brasilense]|uniref:DUF3102 domain-containing protein n=1 Tax=Azospirillum brasilense TaxID=192 RepID=UPI00157BA1C0|nr:DUF3102 domain-containing protein [Azospirillum brasilense]
MDQEGAVTPSGFSAPIVIEQETITAEDWDIPADPGFDYSSIDDNIARQEAVEAAERIKGRLRKLLEEYVGIGFDLIKVKEGIGHGKFQKWIDAEFGMTYKTANNYMNVASRFGKPEIISCLSGVPPTALIHLASAPEGVQEEILEAAASGQRIRVKDVDKAIARAKANSTDTTERSDELRFEAALKRIGADIRAEARAVADERAAAASALISEVMQIVGEVEEAGFPKGCWKRLQAAGKAAGNVVKMLTQACGETPTDDIQSLVKALKRIHSVTYTGKPVDHDAARSCADDLRKAIFGDPDAWNVGSVEPEVEHDDPGDVFSDFKLPKFLEHLEDA